MNLALDRFADNPIIDELVRWPPMPQPMRRIRAASSMFRSPFIEVELADGETFQRHFPRRRFAEDWAEARILLDTLTDIELVSEFEPPAVADAETLRAEALQVLEESIAEAEPMFAQGMYRQYLLQFGPNCKNLPPEVLHKLETARAAAAD